MNSPYITFGTETDNELLKAIQSQHTQKVYYIVYIANINDDSPQACQDITTYNISSLITKLSGERITKSSSSAKPSCAKEIITEEDEDNTDTEPVIKTKDDVSTLYKCMLS